MHYSRRQLIIWASQLSDSPIHNLCQLSGSIYLKIFIRIFPSVNLVKINHSSSPYNNEKNFRALQKLMVKQKAIKQYIDFLPFFYGKTTDRNHVQLLLLLRSLYDKQCGISTQKLKGKSQHSYINKRKYKGKSLQDNKLAQEMKKAAQIQIKNKLSQIILSIKSELNSQENLKERILKVISQPKDIDDAYKKLQKNFY